MKNKRSRFLNIAVTLCAAGSVFANGMAASAAEQSENLDSYQGEEYVVTATRTELTAKEVPQSVEVITKEEIQNIGAINVQDALRIATNVNVHEAGALTTQVGIRGGDSDDMLILINGRRVANEGVGMDSGNEFALGRININNVERIEILRGPAGALYGSDAMNGVINIITKKAEKPEYSVGFATGSREMNNYYHLDTGVDGKLSATFDANFTKSRYFKWDATPGSKSTSRPYGYKQNYMLDMDYKMDENNKLNLYAAYDKENLRYDSFDKNGIRTSVNNFEIDRKTAALTYQGSNDNSNYSLSTTFSRLEREYQDKVFKYFNVEARDTIQTSENNKLTFGGEFRNDKAPVSIDGSNVDKDVNQYAVYLHDELKLGKKLLVIPSVRYDHHEEFGSNTSPNIGATYFFTDNSRLKANYGEGYRAPSLNELYYDTDYLKGNPDLKPEKSKGYEISYEQEWDKTEAKLTYFKNKKEDAIEMAELTSAWDLMYTNVSRTSSEGVEFEITQDLGNGFMLTGNYDYLDAKNEDTGERLSLSARNTYTAKLSWTEPVNKEWNVTAWNRWYSDYRYDDKNYSINTFNIVVNKRWGDKYRAFVGIDNLFNKELPDMRYSGRLWRVGAEMTF